MAVELDTDDAAPTGMPVEWYVAFFNDERRYWWSCLCPDGFGHVAAFGYCVEQAVYLLYDVTMTRTLLQALTPSQMDEWVARLPANRRIVAYQPTREPEEPALRLGFWCTPAIAHLVGVRSRALRPQALYRDLIAQGARPAFEGDQA